MMAASPPPERLAARVRRLQIHCQALIDQELVGSYDSTFKGQGIEFEETRPYQSGDDVRAIDWRLTARFGRPFLKLFREERQATVYLMLDGSGSLAGSLGDRTPRDVIAEVAGVLGLIAAQENDRVGLMLFTDSMEHVLPPAGGVSHAMRILRDIMCWQPRGRLTDLRPPLERLCRTERRRCLAVLLSDFLCQEYERSLRVAARAHQLIPVVVTQDVQRRLPPCGLLNARDPETGRRIWIDTFSRRQRDEYRQAAQALEQRRDELFARLQIPPMHLSTQDDVAVELRRYFDRCRKVTGR